MLEELKYDFEAAAASGDSDGPTTLIDERTRFQHIRVTRHPLYGGQLYLDGDLQISESDAAYGAAMVSPLAGLRGQAHIAILGGGDGGVLSSLLQTFHALGRTPPQVTMVDIDARVLEVARHHLPAICGDAFDHPRAHIRIDDALAWIGQARGLDAVIYDLTLQPVRQEQSRGRFIADIVAMIARALRPDGVLSMQCCGHGRADPADLADRREVLPLIRDAVDRHFTGRCEQDVLVPSYGDLWTFLSARRGAE